VALEELALAMSRMLVQLVAFAEENPDHPAPSHQLQRRTGYRQSHPAKIGQEKMLSHKYLMEQA
jgi:hypothetical protein